MHYTSMLKEADKLPPQLAMCLATGSTRVEVLTLWLPDDLYAVADKCLYGSPEEAWVYEKLRVRTTWEQRHTLYREGGLLSRVYLNVSGPATLMHAVWASGRRIAEFRDLLQLLLEVVDAP